MPHLALDDDLSIFYQQQGSGRDVVFLHAFTSNLSCWVFTGILEAFSKDYRTTVYDLRGHGQSSAPQDGYTSDRMAADFARLHDKLGLGPAVLIGHSYGGVIALHAALDHPQKVQGVITSDSFFPGLRHLEPDLGHAEPWQDLRTSLAECGVEIPEHVDFARLFTIAQNLTREQQAKVKEEMGQFSHRWLMQAAALAETTAGRDAFDPAGLTAERIAQVQQPVVGLYDEFTSFDATNKWLSSHLPRYTTDVISKAKHLAPIQNTDGFIAAAKKAVEHIWSEAP
ncbi:MAG TPA: alpha/beta hydrolase [Pirellulales bacterium]